VSQVLLGALCRCEGCASSRAPWGWWYKRITKSAPCCRGSALAGFSMVSAFLGTYCCVFDFLCHPHFYCKTFYTLTGFLGLPTV